MVGDVTVTVTWMDGMLSHAKACDCTLVHMGPFGDDLPDVDGVDHAVDQVKRREAFQAAHPEWRIWCARDSHIWHAERLTEGGRDRLTRHSLRFLLDELERRYRSTELN